MYSVMHWYNVLCESERINGVVPVEPLEGERLIRRTLIGYQKMVAWSEVSSGT